MKNGTIEQRIDQLEAAGVSVVNFEFVAGMDATDVLEALKAIDDKPQFFARVKTIEKIVKTLFIISESVRSTEQFAEIFSQEILSPYGIFLKNPENLLTVTRSFISLMNHSIYPPLKDFSKEQKIVRILSQDRLLTILEQLLRFTDRNQPQYCQSIPSDCLCNI